MTSPSSPVDSIAKAMEGVTNKVTWCVEGYDEATGQVNVVGDGFFIAGVIANQPDQEATAAYIAACSPDLMREVLDLARQAEAMKREMEEKDARIAALEDGLRNLMGCYDTAVSRRRFPPDDFMNEALTIARALIGGGNED